MIKKKRISREVRKYLKLNINENTTQNLWGVAKSYSTL